MPTKSDEIRRLAAEGLSTADIARRLGIRYQHVYGVLQKRASPASSGPEAPKATSTKPILTVEKLIAAGFRHVGPWTLSDDQLSVHRGMPKEVGVNAFAVAGVVQYVGVATMGLAKRTYFYAKPGITQTTSIRINELLRAALHAGDSVEAYVAIPEDLWWNGLPVHGAAGLELGLITRFSLPWNKRSAG